MSERFLFGGPNKKNYSIFGSMLGSPILGNYINPTAT